VASLGAVTTAEGMEQEGKVGVAAAEARPAAMPGDGMADAEMADAMALVARVAGLVVGKADGAELEAVLRVEVVEAAARRLGCQVDAQEPAEYAGMQARFGVDRRADWWEANRVAVVVAMELVPMAVVVAAAARPMARQEGRTVEAATVADHQAASLEAV